MLLRRPSRREDRGDDSHRRAVRIDRRRRRRRGTLFSPDARARRSAFYKPGAKKLALKPWLDHRENLINLNATPPPPIRKVVADAAARTGDRRRRLYLDPLRFRRAKAKPLRLATDPARAGGRWHLAGYDAARHELFLVTETAERKVIQAAKIDVVGRTTSSCRSPNSPRESASSTTPRGEKSTSRTTTIRRSTSSTSRSRRGHEIAIPAYGNDASAVDAANGLLYIGSWAHGEVDVIDLETRTLENASRISESSRTCSRWRSIRKTNTVYFPKGGSAVNGTFGAAVTALDPVTEKTEKDLHRLGADRSHRSPREGELPRLQLGGRIRRGPRRRNATSCTRCPSTTRSARRRLPGRRVSLVRTAPVVLAGRLHLGREKRDPRHRYRRPRVLRPPHPPPGPPDRPRRDRRRLFHAEQLGRRGAVHRRFSRTPSGSSTSTRGSPSRTR